MDDVKTKIAKLLAMANDGRGNEHEMEAALRQAQKLMTKHNIDVADIQMRTGKGPVYNWITILVPVSLPPATSWPLWINFIGTGIGGFTDCHVTLRRHHEHGTCMAYSGDEEDVHYAVWLFKMLRDRIRAESSQYEGSRGERTEFRKGMATRICQRMKDLRAAAKEELEALTGSGSTALAIIDTKIALRDEKFGKQKVRTRNEYPQYGGREAGAKAGDRVGLNRPIGADRRSIGRS